uniref:cytochrome P460 family protein n=1 Tax=Neorhizobium sp. EC2-8 TaxID=3129230 RepID=UPI003100C716
MKDESKILELHRYDLGGGILTATVWLSPSSLVPTPAFAEANQVTFPPLDDLEHYTTVRRGVTREHMLTSRAALDAIKAGQPVPPGTQVVLVDYQSDVLTRYLVAQKTGAGAAEWQYQWFWPDRSVKADENVAQCYSCHRSRAGNQFLFTFDGAVSFQ